MKARLAAVLWGLTFSWDALAAEPLPLFDAPKIYALIESEHKRGYYQGIGEFHLFGNDAKTEWVRKTVDFAFAHNLWLHAHSDDAAVDLLFAHNPKVKIALRNAERLFRK